MRWFILNFIFPWGCDDIIRQHKAACLRVTSLLACKDLLWIGTSAGVLLTMPLPHIVPSTTKLTNIPPVIGVPHGHTGHVRFLTFIEWPADNTQRHSHGSKTDPRNAAKFLVISGGDGYEDFRSSNVSEVAGREDSTNHLLLWSIWCLTWLCACSEAKKKPTNYLKKAFKTSLSSILEYWR